MPPQVEQEDELGLAELPVRPLGQLFHLLARPLEEFALLAPVVLVAPAKPRSLSVQEPVVERVVLHVLALLLVALAFPVPHVVQAALRLRPFAGEFVHALAPERVKRVLLTPLSVRLDPPPLVLAVHEVAGFLAEPRH